MAWCAKAVSRWPATRVGAIAAAIATILALAFVAYRQTSVWTNTKVLYRHALSVTRDNWFAENALGVQAMNQGRSDEALRHFEQSLKDLAPPLRPGYREVHNNLGLLYIGQSRLDDAR